MIDSANWREVPFSPDVLDAWDVQDAGGDEVDDARARLRAQLIATLRELVDSHLTQRQRRIVELYYYDLRTQQEIAAELGISQLVVSRQLFGVLRNGKKIGGAIKRLRNVCDELGIEWV